MRIREIETENRDNDNVAKVTYKQVTPVWRGKHLFVTNSPLGEWQPEFCKCDEYLVNGDIGDCICDPSRVWIEIPYYSVYSIGTGFRFTGWHPQSHQERVMQFAKALDIEKGMDWSLLRHIARAMNRNVRILSEAQSIYDDMGNIVRGMYQDIILNNAD